MMNVFANLVAANEKKLKLNPDARIIGNIIKMCVTNGGYCPCKPIQDQDHLCPCKSVRHDGKCCCHLYVEDTE